MGSEVSRGREGIAKVVTPSSTGQLLRPARVCLRLVGFLPGVIDVCTLTSWDFGKLEKATKFVQISEPGYVGYCAENSLGKRRHP